MTPLTCAVSASTQGVPGKPFLLRFKIGNPGPSAVDLLVWGTPFESDWFAPFVRVQRDGVELTYEGPMVKRGPPTPDDYLRIAARGTRRASIDLARAFDLSKPGLYRVEPALHLHDVAPRGKALAPGRERQPQELPCAVVSFVLRAP